MGKKQRVAEMLDKSGLLTGALALRRLMPLKTLTVLSYHSVATVSEDYPFDPEVIDATPESFREQLRILSRYFRVLSMDEVCDALKAPHPANSLPPNAALITFDDGYKTCHDVALPMLLDAGLSATFFIATDYVERRRPFWWDAIHYILKTTTRPTIELAYPVAMTVSNSERETSIRTLLRLMKTHFGIDERRFVEELGHAADVELTEQLERELANRLIMTWDEIRALRTHGMGVHAHTRTHRVLQTLRSNDLDDELRGSRTTLEKELGAPVRTLAYPVGYSLREHPQIVEAVKSAGYELGFCNGTGLNVFTQGLNRFDMQRIAMERRDSLALFRARVALPML